MNDWSLAVASGDAGRIRELGAEGHSPDEPIDSSGAAALHQCCRLKRGACVQALLATGANVNAVLEPDERVWGYTALHVVSQNGHAGIASALLRAGADMAAPTHDGRTALLLACQHSHLAVVQLLLRYGADRSPATYPGANAEQLAQAHSLARTTGRAAWMAVFGSRSCYAWLAQSRDWCTPLHHLEVLSADEARQLLRSGASLHARVEQAAGESSGSGSSRGAGGQRTTPLQRARALAPTEPNQAVPPSSTPEEEGGDAAHSAQPLSRSLVAASRQLGPPGSAAARVVVVWWRWQRAASLVTTLCAARARAADRLFAPGGAGYFAHAAHFAEGVARQEEARQVAEWIVVPSGSPAAAGAAAEPDRSRMESEHGGCPETGEY